MNKITIKEYEQTADEKVSFGGIEWKRKWDVCIQCNSKEEAERLKDELLNPSENEIQTLTSLGGRLALELECLLLSTENDAAKSKWWDTAHEALEAWRAHLWQASHGDNYVSPLGKD